jgi:hypothetical protein
MPDHAEKFVGGSLESFYFLAKQRLERKNRVGDQAMARKPSGFTGKRGGRDPESSAYLFF